MNYEKYRNKDKNDSPWIKFLSFIWVLIILGIQLGIVLAIIDMLTNLGN